MRHLLLISLLTVGLTQCGGGAPFGTVALGDLTVQGEVDPDYLYLQLHQLDPTFNACYVRALRKNRNARGVIELQMQGDSGRLLSTVTSNSTGSDDLAECVTESMSGLRIVEPDGALAWQFTGDWSVTFDLVAKP